MYIVLSAFPQTAEFCEEMDDTVEVFGGRRHFYCGAFAF